VEIRDLEAQFIGGGGEAVEEEDGRLYVEDGGGRKEGFVGLCVAR